LAAETLAELASDPQAFPGGIGWVKCNDRIGLSGLVAAYDDLLTQWEVILTPEQIARAQTPEDEAQLRERALLGLRVPGAALVLLDNVEPGFPLTRMLDQLAAAGFRALVTSRHDPDSPRVQLYELTVLPPEAAADLFAERFASRGGGYEAERDRFGVLQVVDSLGYLPLAIELAAARAARNGLTAQQLADELRQPGVLDRLKSPTDAQASVRYALERSLVTLAPSQQMRFAALGLLPGVDWPRAVVEPVLAAVPPDASTTPQEDLETLAAFALVTLVPSDGAPPRLRQHPLLHELAEALWQTQPESSITAGRAALVDSLTAYVQQHQHDYGVLARDAVLLDAVIRQGLRWESVQAGALASLDALEDYIHIAGHWRWGQELYTAALAYTRAHDNRQNTAFYLLQQGRLADDLGRYPEAIQLYTDALRLYRDLGSRSNEGGTLNNLGLIATNQGDYAQARDYLEQALAITRDLGNRRSEGQTLHNLGLVASNQGDYAQARAYYEQALAIARDLGDRRSEGQTLNNLGATAGNQGDNNQARAYYEQALPIRRDLGDRRGEGETLNNLGAIATNQRDYGQARMYYEQALAIRRDLGDRRGEGETLNNLGATAANQGDNAQAREYYEQALAIRHDLGDRRGEGVTLRNLGILFQNQGDVTTAQRYYTDAIAILAALGVPDAADTQRRLASLTPPEEPPAAVSTPTPPPTALDISETTPTPPGSVAPTPAERRWFWQRRRKGT
jgi:tetratricopeptide (TPR) repeat protein